MPLGTCQHLVLGSVGEAGSSAETNGVNRRLGYRPSAVGHLAVQAAPECRRAVLTVLHDLNLAGGGS